MPEEKQSQERARLKNAPTTELLQELEGARQELFNLRQEVAMRTIKNTARIWQVRKKIARIQSILRERELLGVRG